MTDRRLRLLIGALALAGVGVASYLVYVHYADIKPFCVSGSGGCEKVQTSSYAKLAGIPVALLGLGGYLAILGSLFVRGEAGRTAAVLVALVGFGFSAYLTWAELFRIHAVCQWCVASAIIMTLIAGLTIYRFLRGAPELEEEPALRPAFEPEAA